MGDTSEVKVQYTPEAIATLRKLQTTNPRMFSAGIADLDSFEAESGLTRWRRRGYAGVTPRAYGFEIRGPVDDQLVLWQQADVETITVWYIGPTI